MEFTAVPNQHKQAAPSRFGLRANYSQETRSRRDFEMTSF